MRRIAKALGSDNAPLGLFGLAERIGARMALKELGMPESGIDEATDIALKNPYWNPAPLERAAIRELIARAWAGAPPQVI
jgi:alcohol dehydrogenase class IV